MKTLAAFALVLVFGALLSSSLWAAAPHIAYTPDQAWNGRLSYYQHCAECHGGDVGGQSGPALAGPNSELQWMSGQAVYAYILGQMPDGNAGALSKNDYVNIMAFLYQQHGKAPSKSRLTEKAIKADTAVMGGANAQ